MVVLLTCKNKEDPIKIEGTRVFTTFYIDFSDAQGQITLELVVVSSQNWNSSKLSCMSLLPTRMKMIHTKMKELEWSQHFSHYKSMGIFQDAQGQLTGFVQKYENEIPGLFQDNSRSFFSFQGLNFIDFQPFFFFFARSGELETGRTLFLTPQYFHYGIDKYWYYR